MRPTVIERAFELAASGEYQRLAHVLKQLDREGYHSFTVQGPVLRRQLTALIKQSAQPAAEAAG